MAKEKKEPQETTQLNMYLPKKLYDDFKKCCEREYCKPTAIAKALIVDYVKKNKT